MAKSAFKNRIKLGTTMETSQLREATKCEHLMQLSKLCKQLLELKLSAKYVQFVAF